MDGGSGLSAGDILALTRDNDNIGGNFWWVIVFLIVASLFRGGLFGNDGNATNAVLGSDEFIKRDIFNTNQNVSATAGQTQRDILESRYTTQLGLQQLQAQSQNCCCETQKEIIQSRYDNSLGQANIQKDILLNGRDLQAQMAQCCCDLRAEGLANTQKILDKMCENEINQLRSDLQSAQFQISQLSQTANITNTLRPFPMPAYLTCSPYQSYGYPYCGVSNVI